MISSKVFQVVVTCQGLVMGSAFRRNDMSGLQTASLGMLVENLRVLGHQDEIQVECYNEMGRRFIVESWWTTTETFGLSVLLVNE